MANIRFANFARSQLAAGLAPGDLSLSVVTTHGARFPTLTGAQYFYVVLENAALDREIVKVTARAGDLFTIVRAQDGTTALSWNAGDVVALRMVAAALQDAIDAAAGGDFAPLAGAVFTGAVEVPAGATGAEVPQAQEVAVLATTQLGGNRNKITNGDFSSNQRGATSVADDAYCLDGWYVLTESGNVTVAQLTDPEPGAPFGIRLTQPDASPKRMGFAHIIESKDIRQYASAAMHLGARLRLSTSANIRYAVIEHTGTADSVTSDVVNNWASATYTPSNFFIAGVNIISTGTIAPGAATWGAVSDWDALGASVKNVVVFIWTESQVAQNVTLDCSRIQYEPGVVATPHEWRLNELALCQRRYCVTHGHLTAYVAAGGQDPRTPVYWPVTMRAVPTTTNTGGAITNASSADLGGISIYGAHFRVVATAAGLTSVTSRVITASADL